MAEEVPLNAAEIFRQINGGDSGQSLTGVEEATARLRDLLADFTDEATAIHQEMNQGWEGEAADAASGAGERVIMTAALDVAHLARANDAVIQQLNAYHTAKNAIVELEDDPPMDDGVVTSATYGARVALYESFARKNIEAYTTYHQASTANAASMPSSFGSLADAGGPIGVVRNDAARDTGVTAPRDTPTPTAPPATPSTAVPPRSTTGPVTASPGDIQRNTPAADRPGPGVNMGHADSPTGPEPGDTTQAAAFTPQPIPPVAAGPSPYEFGPTGSPINHLNTGNGPWAPPNPYAGVGYRTGNPTTGTPGAGTGNPTTGARPGSVGRGTGAVPAPGGGTGARVPGEPLARGGAGGTGTGTGGRATTGGPVAGMGGGRGRGEDDKDRKHPPYLRDPDPDDTFAGPHEKTAPPVLGERDPNR